MDAGHAAQQAAETTDPRIGLRAVVAMRRAADALEQRHVEAALAQGLTWETIASSLGVSRQAVHKKYKSRVPAHLLPTRKNR